MKKETWIRADIWEKSKVGLKCTRFTKYIEGELLVAGNILFGLLTIGTS